MSRLRGIRRALKKVDGILVTSMPNVRYLTGFTGSSGFALITADKCLFATDSRYTVQAAKEVGPPWELADQKSHLSGSVKALARKLGVRRLAVEDSITMRFARELSGGFDEVVPLSGVVEKLRTLKDEDELASITLAIRRAERAFLKVRPHIKAGARESAIARRLEGAVKAEGARRLPFEIIVASGENSALPHAGVTDRVLGPGDLVVIDWGAEAGGYYSDMTRTLLIDGPDMGPGLAQKKRIYSLVLRANRAALAAVKPSAKVGSVDKAARDVIKKAGYGDFFGHAVGHGVGLEVHEAPGVSAASKGILRKGMVLTVEPGIYVPGLGGVRIEDMVLVGPGGGKLMTKLKRSLHAA